MIGGPFLGPNGTIVYNRQRGPFGMTAKLEFDDFVFDTERLELCRAGRPVKLTGQPARLLALLLAQPGELVSREALQKALWDDDTFVDFDLGINSCVRQVRFALGDDANRPRFIETVPKRGYRFIGTIAPTVEAEAEAARRSRSKLGLLAAAIAVAVIALAVWRASDAPERSEPRTPTPQLVVALPFDNVNDDPELEWLRLGLAELLVTGIAQRASVNVLPMGTVFDLLQRDGELPYRVTTPDVVSRTLSATGADVLVHGTFIRVDGATRIQLTVRDTAKEKTVTTKVVEAPQPSEIFETMDRLALDMRRRLEVIKPEKARGVADLTTGSIDAFRLFAVAMSRPPARRAELLEEALAIDPEFAYALAALATHYFEMGLDLGRARDYAARAMRLSDKLPARARYEVEGRFYSLVQETWGQAIDAYRGLSAMDPYSHLLGNRFRWLENYDACIESLAPVVHLGETSPNHPSYNRVAAHNILASCYAAKGELDAAESMLRGRRRGRVSSTPFDVVPHVLNGDFARAETKVIRALAEAPSHTGLRAVAWQIALIQGKLDDAEAMVAEPLPSSPPQLRWYRLHARAVTALHRGRPSESLASLDEAIAVFDEPHRNQGHSHNLASRVLLELEGPEKAAVHATEAQTVAPGDEPEWEGLFWTSIAKAEWDYPDKAAELAARLSERTASIPFDKEKRRRHWLAGRLKGFAGDPDAVRELELAEALLPASGRCELLEGHLGLPQHVPIWYALANASLASGDDARAQMWLEKIVGATFEQVWWPLETTRSLYLLAELLERHGAMDEALPLYGRFYQRWKDGELDRERVSIARDKIRVMESD